MVAKDQPLESSSLEGEPSNHEPPDNDQHSTHREDRGDEADQPNNKAEEEDPNNNNKQKDATFVPQNWSQRYAVSMAHRPCQWLAVALLLTLTLSAIGIVVGDFEVAVDNNGWTSRGTLISNRETQVFLVTENRDALLQPDNEWVWEDLLNNVQEGWTDDDDDGRRRVRRNLRPAMSRRGLQQNDVTEAEAAVGQLLEGCSAFWYDPDWLFDYEHLWPVWKVNKSGQSALSGDAIVSICQAEENTNRVLKDTGLCDTCGTRDTCLPPYSLVFFVRLVVQDYDFALSCENLATEWETNYRASVEPQLGQCVQDIRVNYNPEQDLPESCPFGFHPSLVDEYFSTTNPIVTYTSTVFLSTDDIDTMWDNVDDFDRAGNVLTGTYDTKYEAFVEFTADEALVVDMSLALGSALVTGIAILVHTRSPFLTGVGLCQIILSFPLAFFVYSLVAQLTFFPFLNFIGVFVVFALGADDIFVAVDKWKNARLEHKKASTQEIAAIALPDAAQSMFLTTVTTAVAFFGTAICPVAPLKLFAVFNGLLISFDYILCVFLVFPALCLYDKWVLRGTNYCVSCHCCHRLEAHGEDALEGDNHEETSESFIRRLLTKLYNAIHTGRWALVVVCIAATVVAGVFAATLELPDSSDVRVLDSSNEYEKNYEWRLKLLDSVLEKQSGSVARIIWGVRAGDTGNHNDPSESSQLLLDGDFDPSSEAAQEFLLGFCPTFFNEEFARKIDDGFECSMNTFNEWLSEQSSMGEPSDEYKNLCNGATNVPVPQESFHSCIVGWSQLVGDRGVLQRNGKVTIMLFPYQSRVRYDSPYEDLDDEWHLVESWLDEKSDNVAPVGVGNFYSSSDDYWWYDTNGSMLKTAYGAAGIALAAAAVVMLFSSRSFEITLFALVTIGFILLSVTSALVASGWSLGFLESVCFAILIGISADFVLHFGHSYSSLPGDRSRHERSKYALLRMGPSILAAAFTTVCAAIVMFFTTITFFQKFAQILFFTIVMATAGSFIFFITLSDTFGPSKPTAFVDGIVGKLCGGNTGSNAPAEATGAKEMHNKSNTAKQPGVLASTGTSEIERMKVESEGERLEL